MTVGGLGDPLGGDGRLEAGPDQGQRCEDPTAVEEIKGGGSEVVDVSAQAVGQHQLLLVELALAAPDERGVSPDVPPSDQVAGDGGDALLLLRVHRSVRRRLRHRRILGTRRFDVIAP